jgi:hypothetical protein
MNDDFDSPHLEDRLRREADTLSSRYGGQCSAAALIAEHRRRRRRRIGRLAAGACVAGVIFGAASWPWASRQFELAVPTSVVEAPSPAPPESPFEAPINAPGSAVVQKPPEESATAASQDPVPFLVTEQDGRRVIAVGVYVPPRVEQVDLRDLSPLEQAAVRRVLGLEEEAVKPTI